MEKHTDHGKAAAMLEDNPYEAQLRRIDGLTQRALEFDDKREEIGRAHV